MYVVLESFVQHETVMRTLGAVAIVIRSPVVVLSHGFGKYVLCALYVLGYARQVRQFERRAVLFDKPHQVYAVKSEVVTVEAEFFLREIKRLVDKVYVTCLHPNTHRD